MANARSLHSLYQLQPKATHVAAAIALAFWTGHLAARFIGNEKVFSLMNLLKDSRRNRITRFRLYNHIWSSSSSLIHCSVHQMPARRQESSVVYSACCNIEKSDTLPNLAPQFAEDSFCASIQEVQGLFALLSRLLDSNARLRCSQLEEYWTPFIVQAAELPFCAAMHRDISRSRTTVLYEAIANA